MEDHDGGHHDGLSLNVQLLMLLPWQAYDYG
jgi:hypothetical protein